MDFRKIEHIFLIAFLGLNIFLLTIFTQNLAEASNIGTSEEKDAIETRLAKDKIEYEDELADTIPQGYYLSAEETVLTTSERSTLNGNSTVSPTNGTLLLTEDYLINSKTQEADVASLLSDSKLLPYPHEYQYLAVGSSLVGNAPYIMATLTYEDLPIFDATAQMKIYLANVSGDVYRVDKLQYSHLDNITNLREKQDLISEKAAITTLYYNSKLPAGSTINWRMLAYGRTLKVGEKNVYVPIWFVSVTGDDGEHIEEVNAVNNNIITSNTITTVEN